MQTRLAQWFLSLPFISVNPSSNPTSDQSLAGGLGFQSLPDCLGFLPHLKLNISSHFLFILLLALIAPLDV